MADSIDTTTIVVAADFDESGAAALRCGHELAVRYAPCALHVVHAIPPEKRDVARLSETLQETMEQLQAHVTAVLAEIAVDQEADIEPHGHVRIGEPAEAIHQCAIDVDADLIVVGTHNRKGLERLVLGSVSEDLIRRAHAPVVVARDKDYGGMRHSEIPDAPRPGQDMKEHSLTDRLVLRRVQRNSHIPGLL